ncbi:hypothetical protein [Cellulomonas sp. NS3]|uniref:hypothetical protein n=1 Tax=Cellulomonas sp. NS3 TaxID=2973977 RepID=UPI002163E7FC|nr:hypothetical protein [Cellulomonas sp. NS3]
MWSWAGSAAEVEARRRDADELVGARIRAVRYFTLDYRRHELHPGLVDDGPRNIDAELEWNDPTWLFDGFDAVDHGFEVATDGGAVFSLTWDPPGEREGIGLQPTPMLGSGVRSDADVAIWDVGEHAPSWAPMVGGRVTGVDLHYVPWDEALGSFWCPRITIRGEGDRVDVVLGDSLDGVLVPSSDNIAVVHPGTPLPSWLD